MRFRLRRPSPCRLVKSRLTGRRPSTGRGKFPTIGLDGSRQGRDCGVLSALALARAAQAGPALRGARRRREPNARRPPCSLNEAVAKARAGRRGDCRTAGTYSRAGPRTSPRKRPAPLDPRRPLRPAADDHRRFSGIPPISIDPPNNRSAYLDISTPPHRRPRSSAHGGSVERVRATVSGTSRSALSAGGIASHGTRRPRLRRETNGDHRDPGVGSAPLGTPSATSPRSRSAPGREGLPSAGCFPGSIASRSTRPQLDSLGGDTTSNPGKGVSGRRPSMSPTRTSTTPTRTGYDGRAGGNQGARRNSSTRPPVTTARRQARRRSTPAPSISSEPSTPTATPARIGARPTSAPTSSCRRPPAPVPARSSR